MLSQVLVFVLSTLLLGSSQATVITKTLTGSVQWPHAKWVKDPEPATTGHYVPTVPFNWDSFHTTVSGTLTYDDTGLTNSGFEVRQLSGPGAVGAPVLDFQIGTTEEFDWGIVDETAHTDLTHPSQGWPLVQIGGGTITGFSYEKLFVYSGNSVQYLFRLEGFSWVIHEVRYPQTVVATGHLTSH